MNLSQTPSAKGLLQLPDEVILSILYFLEPATTVTVLLTSKRLNQLADEPLLWRWYCRTCFNHWDASHDIKSKLVDSLSAIDWKSFCLTRCRADRHISKLLDGIINSQVGRIERFQKIVEYGYDAKDTLLRHLQVTDDAEDVLARRYFSTAVLRYVHRTMATKEWFDLTRGGSPSLERALSALDVFVMPDGENDFCTISGCLADLATQCANENSSMDEMTAREKALTIAKFVRERNLTGMDETKTNFYDLQNNFLGLALLDEQHRSLPLVSVAIFCCVAQRLGLDAQPCGLPQKVHAIVCPPPGQTMDGKDVDAEDEVASMYLDPFSTDEEIPLDFLHSKLRDFGIYPSSYSEYLGPMSIPEAVMRSSRNIVQSLRNNRQRGIAVVMTREASESARRPVDAESSVYAALWAPQILRSMTPTPFHLGRDLTDLSHIMQSVQEYFPEDVFLVEKYIAPLLDGLPQHVQLMEMLRAIRAGDAMPKRPNPRVHQSGAQGVKYKIGQVFRHKRYDYLAFITGWDAKCEKEEEWVQRMDVDSLPGGRQQSFYHAVVQDKSVRYVAEENIHILKPEGAPPMLLPLAGKYFRRWDQKSAAFISNVKEEYPDD
ncbi:MAG: hypothetical protein M1833_004697 [Piccolia ochrophora]|nr:MAG: hypothetical protein M1833_004697 [Piccolia ochrophora]